VLALNDRVAKTYLVYVWLVLWQLCIASRLRRLFETRHSLAPYTLATIVTVLGDSRQCVRGFRSFTVSQRLLFDRLHIDEPWNSVPTTVWNIIHVVLKLQQFYRWTILD